MGRNSSIDMVQTVCCILAEALRNSLCSPEIMIKLESQKNRYAW